MSVSDKYPELVRQFFLLDEVKEILPNYPKYKILLQTPEVDREYYKNITSPEFIRQWQPEVLNHYRNNWTEVTPLCAIVHDRTIDAGLRIQKFFHPSILPNELHGDVWILVKENKEELDAFIENVQCLQNYVRDSSNSKYTYYRCEYCKKNKGVKSKKTDCKHKIAVHALEGGKYKIVWHFQHNHAFDPRRITKATRNWLMDLASTNIPRASSDSRRSVTKFKLSSFLLSDKFKISNKVFNYYKNKNKESQAHLDKNVIKSLKIWVSYINTLNEFAVFKKRSTNTENAEFCDVEGDALNPESTWYFGIILLSNLQYMLSPQTVFLDSTHKLGHGPHNEDIITYIFITKSSLSGGGIPIGYLITNRESHEPLASFLRFFVEKKIQIKRFVIDCSATEIKAIEEGYNVGIIEPTDGSSSAGDKFEAIITFCTWHCLRAFNKAIKKGITIQNRTNNVQIFPNEIITEVDGEMTDEEFINQIATQGVVAQSNLTAGRNKEEIIANQRIALSYMVELKRKKAIEEANDFLHVIEATFREYPDFVAYAQKTFKTTGKYWLNCHFGNYRELTNNCVKSYHQVLKTKYFERRRKYRVDRVIWMFIEPIAKYYEYYHSAVIVTSLLRYIDKAEEASKLKAEAVSDEDMRQMIVDLPGYIAVKSFNGSNYYKISFGERGIFSCECPYNEYSIDWCKHIFLYKRYKVAKGLDIPFVELERNPLADLSGLNGTNEIVERETDTIGDESEDEELVDSESGFKNATYNESDFGDDNFDSMENDPDGDEPDFSIENTEPTEVSQEETEEEIGARLARDRVDPGFSIDDDNIGNDFELADSSQVFTDGGTAYYTQNTESDPFIEWPISETIDLQESADVILEIESIEGVYAKKAARNIKQREENYSSLDTEVKRIQDEEKSQREKVKKLRALIKKEEMEHKKKMAAVNRIQKKRNKEKELIKTQKKALAEIQRIERMIRDNNYSEEEEHEKTEELKRLYHSTMLDSNRKQSRY